MSFGSTVYRYGLYITWGVVFIMAYIYCVKTYGFALGGGVGWLPSAIAAYVAGLVWPAVVPLLAFMLLSGRFVV
ncbi:hypothetical protein EP073_06115 [Geovibrio thiophilus]|uniref:Uncharacterized protein n=1 Tax=Geovibrio thiophilus TaxID=139438 RepID=A0A3R5V119_9BACT|nr:hypothetical protein [Geovibrio thiophilus]QAR32997.1 hypothetical protein EP073_06115 [Geovibrio thiophilus]